MAAGNVAGSLNQGHIPNNRFRKASDQPCDGPAREGPGRGDAASAKQRLILLMCSIQLHKIYASCATKSIRIFQWRQTLLRRNQRHTSLNK